MQLTQQQPKNDLLEQWELSTKGRQMSFYNLNSVLAPMISIFALMVGVKMGCHFNNSMFFIKKYN